MKNTLNYENRILNQFTNVREIKFCETSSFWVLGVERGVFSRTKAQGALLTPDMLKQTFEVAFLCHIKGLA
jgi:hypothetical protein